MRNTKAAWLAAFQVNCDLKFVKFIAMKHMTSLVILQRYDNCGILLLRASERLFKCEALFRFMV